MKAVGKMIFCMVWAFGNTRMEISTMVRGKKVKDMDLVSISILMKLFMLGNSVKAKWKGKVTFITQMVIDIKGNGTIVKNIVKEFLPG